MYLLLIVTIVGIIIGLYKCGWDDLDNFFNNIGRAFVGFFVGGFVGILVGALLALLVGTILKNYHPEDIVENVEGVEYISTLQDNYGVSGSFFLGSGSIDGEMKYAYYVSDTVQTSPKIVVDYSLELIDTDIVTVRFINDSTIIPHIAKIRKNYYSNWAMWSNIYRVIYVPKGTIRNEFKLDAR